MKIIFLDIDGVLNNNRWASTWNFLWGGNGFGGFNKLKLTRRTIKWDPYNVRELKNIMNRTGAKIVISSTWRYTHNIDHFKTMFDLYGLKADHIIDLNIDLRDQINTTRGDEVNRYLADNPGITNYVILDDGSDFYVGQKLVQTNEEFGLTDEDAYRAIQILNGEDRLKG